MFLGSNVFGDIVYCIDVLFDTLHFTWISIASTWPRLYPESDLSILLSVYIYIYTYVFHRTTIYVHISATSILDATCFCANYWQGRRAYSRLTFTYYHICDIFQLLFLLCPFASTVEQDLWHNHFTNKNIGSELDQLWMWNNIKWLPRTYHDISIYAAMNCTF